MNVHNAGNIPVWAVVAEKDAGWGGSGNFIVSGWLELKPGETVTLARSYSQVVVGFTNGRDRSLVFRPQNPDEKKPLESLWVDPINPFKYELGKDRINYTYVEIPTSFGARHIRGDFTFNLTISPDKDSKGHPYKYTSKRMYEFAENHRYGNAGTKKDLAKAFEWYYKAAESGHVKAMGDVGFFYQAIEKYELSMHWYRKNASLDGSEGAYRMALLYMYGKGVTRDVKEAMLWMRKAADKKHGPALILLGDIYVTRAKGEQDSVIAAELLDAAIELYGTAARPGSKWGREKGHMIAMNRLGMHYLGQDNHGEALRWFHSGADAGDDDSMYRIGLAYENGRGIAVDAKQATEWFRKAAELGHTTAMLKLSEAYSQGYGVAQDSENAEYWSKQTRNNQEAGEKAE